MPPQDPQGLPAGVTLVGGTGPDNSGVPAGVTLVNPLNEDRLRMTRPDVYGPPAGVQKPTVNMPELGPGATATSFGAALSNLPRQMWEGSFFGELGNPRVRAMHEARQAQERQAMQGSAGEAIRYTAGLANPVARTTPGDPTSRVDIGQTAVNLLPYAVAGAVRAYGPRTAIPTEEAVSQIKNAVNPHPAAVEGFESTLKEQMPRIVDYAKRQGIKIQSRASLAKAMEGAGDEAYNHYYDNYIKPVKDVTVPTQNIPGYKGAMVDHNTATIQGLEDRLSTINATLYPKFQKGGVAAEAAISAENAQSLGAEAAAIREMMNQTIGNRLGIPADQVAAQRSEFGSLRDAADKTVRAINEEQYGKNLSRRGAEIPLTRPGLVREGIKVLTRENPDKAIKQAMERIRTPAPEPRPKPTPEQAARQAAKTAQEQVMQQRLAQVRAAQQRASAARDAVRQKASAIKAAADKLGPRASVREIMAEADRITPSGGLQEKIMQQLSQEGEGLYVSIERLQKATGATREQVDQALQELHNAKKIQRTESFSAGKTYINAATRKP